MLDGSARVLACTNDRDSREDRVFWEGGDDRLLDVEAVLQQRDGSVTRSDGGCDHLCHRRRNVGIVLSSDYYKVKRGQRLCCDVGNGIANWGTRQLKLGMVIWGTAHWLRAATLRHAHARES